MSGHEISGKKECFSAFNRYISYYRLIFKKYYRLILLEKLLINF